MASDQNDGQPQADPNYEYYGADDVNDATDPNYDYYGNPDLDDQADANQAGNPQVALPFSPYFLTKVRWL